MSRRYPTVSVVIPTRNRTEMLREAVASAIGQTYAPMEIIVVDDASDNGSADFPETAGPELRRLRHRSPLGAAAARNTGITHARGDLIAFLDDDDLWVPEKLERQVSAMDGNVATICSASKRSGRDAAKKLPCSVGPELLRKGFEFGSGSSGIVVRAEDAREIRFDESLPCGQDWDFAIRLLERGPIRHLPEPLVLYNDGAHDRITAANRVLPLERLHERTRIIRKHQAFFGPYWARRHLARFLFTNFRSRPDKLRHTLRVYSECGAVPMAGMLWGQARRVVEARILRIQWNSFS